MAAVAWRTFSHHLSLPQEYVLDLELEELDDAEREREGRIELAVLHRVDRVAGDTDLLGEFGLAPALLSARRRSWARRTEQCAI